VTDRLSRDSSKIRWVYLSSELYHSVLTFLQPKKHTGTIPDHALDPDLDAIVIDHDLDLSENGDLEVLSLDANYWPDLPISVEELGATIEG